MKSGEVLRTLNISRPTLSKYVKLGILKVTEMPNGRYDYDDESVYAFLNKGIKRKTYLYASTDSEAGKVRLKKQINTMTQFCFMNGYTVNGVFEDIAADNQKDNRVSLYKMLDDVIDSRVERIVVMEQGDIAQTPSELRLLRYILDRFNCRLVIMSEVTVTQ